MDNSFLLDAMDWSYSRVSSFDQCPRMFDLTYLQCMDRVDNAFAQWGSLAHSLLERYFRQQVELWDLSGLYEKEYARAVTERFPFPRLEDSYYERGMELLTDPRTGEQNKVRDNYHTILIAKNYTGLQEMNELISRSNQGDHFYYKPRITFDEFLGISSNVIKISACLASPLNRMSITHPMYERLLKHYDYLEIQAHDHPEQVAYNRHLAEMSQKYGIPLIAGTDTHSLNKYKAECRTILQLSKHIEFADEDTFDLTYKSYDELVAMFATQDALPEAMYLEAIENTNRMADSVEPFELDISFKYPIATHHWFRRTGQYCRRSKTGLA